MASAKRAPRPDPRAALIDEYAVLALEAEAWKPKQKRLEALRAQILGWLPPALNGEEGATFESASYAVDVTPRQNERKIRSMAAVARFFGKRFFELCTVPLRYLDSEMTAEERTKHLVEEHTGPRKLAVRKK